MHCGLNERFMSIFSAFVFAMPPSLSFISSLQRVKGCLMWERLHAFEAVRLMCLWTITFRYVLKENMKGKLIYKLKAVLTGDDVMLQTSPPPLHLHSQSQENKYMGVSSNMATFGPEKLNSLK